MSKIHLKDIAEITMGQSPKTGHVNTKKIGYPLLNGPTEFTDFFPIPVQYSDKGNKFAEKGDILFCVRGSTTGKMNFADQKYVIGRGIASIKGSNGYSTDFVRVVLEQKLPYILSSATGSTFPNVGREQLQKLEIESISTIKANQIGQFYRNFSNQIHLNTQINQTLEAIAQAIFKSWFIDFDPVKAKAQAISEGKTAREANLAAMAVISGKAVEELNETEFKQLWEIAEAFPSELVESEEFGEVPKGWGVTTLSEICSMQNGYAFKSNEWTESGIPVIKIGSVKPMIVDIENNGFVAEENEFLRSDFLLTTGDIVVGLTGYVGEVGRIPAGDKAMLNQRVAKFIPKKLDDKLSYYNFVYCLARQKTFKEYAELNAKGSAQANISTKELLNYPTCIGTKKIHLFFEKQVNEILEKILLNSQENKILSKTRDLLLPKLLNGEI